MKTQHEIARTSALAKVRKPEISEGLAKTLAANFMDFRKSNPDATLEEFLDTVEIKTDQEFYTAAIKPYVIPAGSTRDESVMEACNVGPAATAYPSHAVN